MLNAINSFLKKNISLHRLTLLTRCKFLKSDFYFLVKTNTNGNAVAAAF